MSFDPISAAFDIGRVAIEKIWPDPTKRAEEMRKLEELRQTGDVAQLNAHVQLMLGQMEINKVEAAHPSRFIAGWRPATGWVCAASLALAFIPKAMVMTLMWSYSCYLTFSAFDPNLPGAVLPALPVFPDMGLGDILGILGGLLGMGTMRSFDKRAGVQTVKTT